MKKGICTVAFLVMLIIACFSLTSCWWENESDTWSATQTENWNTPAKKWWKVSFEDLSDDEKREIKQKYDEIAYEQTQKAVWLVFWGLDENSTEMKEVKDETDALLNDLKKSYKHVKFWNSDFGDLMKTVPPIEVEKWKMWDVKNLDMLWWVIDMLEWKVIWYDWKDSPLTVDTYWEVEWVNPKLLVVRMEMQNTSKEPVSAENESVKLITQDWYEFNRLRTLRPEIDQPWYDQGSYNLNPLSKTIVDYVFDLDNNIDLTWAKVSFSEDIVFLLD